MDEATTGLLGSLKTRIGELLDGKQSVCLWFSGGSDSRLLLEVMFEAKKPFGILTFEDGWDREQRKAVDAMIIEKNLQVFSYPPAARFLVAEGEEVSLITGYAIDAAGHLAVLARDLIDNPERCAFDVRDRLAHLPYAPQEWNVHVWGSRTADTHWISRGPVLKGGAWVVGDKKFIAPLADWTREQVIEALAEYGVQPTAIDTGDLHCCFNCLKGEGGVYCPKAGNEIDSVEWDREANRELVDALLG